MTKARTFFASSLFPELEKEKKYFFLIIWVLSFLSVIYRLVVAFRFWLYKKKLLKMVNLSVPVVSVGNLTVGGTGKTPILIYLANLITSQGKRVGIVSRNYKSATKEILKVVTRNDGGVGDGRLFGDEPVLIQQKTHVPVYVGPRKVDTAKEIIRSEKIEYVMIDDGFQHLALKKNCNILLFDVTQMDLYNQVLPRGRYREPLAGFKKADIIFWTKTNFISDQQLAQLKKMIVFSGLQVDWQFCLSEIEFPGFPTLNLNSENKMKTEFSNIRRFVLISGIARPEYFVKIVQDLNPRMEIIEKTFSDHHQYSEQDLKKILDKPLNFHHFLTTEKDYTKLKDIWPKDTPLGIVKWEPRPNISDRQLYESIISFLH
ncbi:MAG: tetraacyldisaccharide 4'-kinase [Bdellovibrionaceae bacterium]|nr:tetraacyldisaccharide 4'-kinase [Pseudobdellovibrionaceae bacterium]